MLDLNDTIAALASAPGGAARAIVRLCGPDMLNCLGQCFVADDKTPLRSVRRPTAIAGKIAITVLTSPLPCVLYLWPSTRSYTRQPTAELHTLGSPPLVDALLTELCAHGARPAEAGEFTLRAFLAGRIDLTQAEAVLGVIDARGRGDLDAALAQLAGGLAAPLARLRGDLLDVLAHLEAGLDFVDEDIEFISRADLARQVAEAQDEVARLAERMQTRGEAAGDLRAVLIGAPNVGKSSLFNALGGGRALVSDRPGTTRDYLTARLDIGGILCELVDTAGMEGLPGSGIERAAQEASLRQRRQAEIQLVCLDATRPLTADEETLLAQPSVAERIVVLTKTDRPRAVPPLRDAIETSSRTGAGLDRLRDRLGGAARAGATQTGIVAATGVRCEASLRQAAVALAEARDLAETAAGEELVAAELRGALHYLGEVAGVVYTDDILDRVFSRFCIGK